MKKYDLLVESNDNEPIEELEQILVLNSLGYSRGPTDISTNNLDLGIILYAISSCYTTLTQYKVHIEIVPTIFESEI